jgi:DNA-binding GntR family transcriptional regulator
VVNTGAAAQGKSSVRPIVQTSAVDQVTREIRRSILSGDLRPGQQFSLREIATDLGVSFIPVREALRRLEGQGLVSAERGKSATVTPLSQEDLHGIYRLRRRLEPEIASRSCKQITDAQLDDLKAIVQTFADESLGIDDIYEAHHDFHLALLRPAATAWDLRTLESLWHAAERYIRLAFSGRDTEPGEAGRRMHAHEDLLETFRSGSPKAVSAAVLHHLDENEKMAQTALP